MKYLWRKWPRVAAGFLGGHKWPIESDVTFRAYPTMGGGNGATHKRGSADDREVASGITTESLCPLA